MASPLVLVRDLGEVGTCRPLSSHSGPSPALVSVFRSGLKGVDRLVISSLTVVPSLSHRASYCYYDRCVMVVATVTVVSGRTSSLRNLPVNIHTTPVRVGVVHSL